MNHNYRSLSWLVLSAFLSVLLFFPKAGWSRCRNAVVVYLDVSGSMYWDDHKVYSMKKPGNRITLMEGMSELIDDLFIGDSAIVDEDDHLEFRGFFSKVAPLNMPQATPSEKPPLNELVNLRDLLAAKSKFDNTDFRETDPSDSSQLSLKTDFEAVIRDMDRIYARLALAEFNQTLFIILTDGGHFASSAARFKETISRSQIAVANNESRKIPRIHLFCMNSKALKPHEYDVKQDFQTFLGAEAAGLEGDRATLSSIRKKIKQLISFSTYAEKTRMVFGEYGNCEKISLKLANDSCGPVKIRRIAYSLFRKTASTIPERESSMEAIIEDIHTLSPLIELGEIDSGRSVSQELRLDLGRREFAPGHYMLKVVPEAQNGATGKLGTYSFEIKPLNADIEELIPPVFNKEKESALVSLRLSNGTSFRQKINKIHWSVQRFNTNPDGSPASPIHKVEIERVMRLSPPVELDPVDGGNPFQEVSIEFNTSLLSPGRHRFSAVPETVKGVMGDASRINFKMEESRGSAKMLGILFFGLLLALPIAYFYMRFKPTGGKKNDEDSD